MKPIVINMQELSESVEVYESKPNPFFEIFIYLLLLMSVSTILFMYFAKIDITMKASGIIKPRQSIATVTNTLSGKIEEIYVSNGQIVSQGDRKSVV